MRKFLITTLFAAFALPALAKSPPADPPQAADIQTIDQCLAEQKAKNADAGVCVGKVSDPCMSTPAGGTTYGMMDCSKREIAVWDSKLNTAYLALQKDASPKLKSTLRDAQRAWITDKEKTCLIPYAVFEGGTIAGPMGGACVNEFTARRFLLLNDYLHYAE
jgi:uncharacterized protein YecT (DUF1311 family)